MLYFLKLTEDCIVKTKHDDLLLYSFSNSANLVQLPSLYDFFLHFEKITKKKLQKSLAGFYKIEPASYREIKLYLTAKKYSYDKRKQESKQVVGFQIFFDSIFVWFISSRSWNLIFFFWIVTITHLRIDCLNPWCPFSLDSSIWACSYANRKILYLSLISDHDQAQAGCVDSVPNGTLFLVTWYSLLLFLT